MDYFSQRQLVKLMVRTYVEYSAKSPRHGQEFTTLLIDLLVGRGMTLQKERPPGPANLCAENIELIVEKIP